LPLMAEEEKSEENETTSEAKISRRKLKRLQVEAASKLQCQLCPDKKFTSLKMFDDHIASKKHQKKKLRKDTFGTWFCQACDLKLSSQKEWMKHLCGGRHNDKLKEWSMKMFVNSSPITQQEIDLLDDSHYEETEEDNDVVE